ncbi:MAG: protein kinase [Chloroflexi bacterium]|nr:protein kinase [Chloroflexota bacterium]
MNGTKIDRYELKSELGRGGMATVYLAWDPRFERNVAIKLLPRQFLHDPTFRARFQREARMIAQLEHTAIVPVYDFGEHEEQPYLVMRFMDGGTLADLLANGPVPTQQAAFILQRIASALDYAHSRGIIHRDLKPGNILFDNQQNAYLGDFGIAKLAQATTTFTGSAIIGTPAYMSPEQVHGDKEIDGRSDIYTLGVILFEMLTGEMPYRAKTPAQLLMAHVLQPVPRILETKADLPLSCDMLIRQAMAKNRDERFSTARQMAEALALLAEGTVGAVTSPTQENPHDSGETIVTPVTWPPPSATTLAPMTPPISTGMPIGTASEGLFPFASSQKSRTWLYGGIGLVVLAAIVVGVIFMFRDGMGNSVQEDATLQALVVTVGNDAASLPTVTIRATNTAVSRETASPAQAVVDSAASSTTVATATKVNLPTSTPQPTRTSVATATPYPQLRITLSSVNVRSGPGTGYTAVTLLPQGTIVRVIASSNDGTWYNIELPDGNRGWISESVAERVNSASFADVRVAATIPPLPTATRLPATITPVPYGGNFTWVDPFQDYEMARQASSDRLLWPLATASTLLVLLAWLGARLPDMGQRFLPRKGRQAWARLTMLF